MTEIISFIGFLFLIVATDIGRPKEYSLKAWTPKWWWMLALITAGVMLIKYADRITP